jgi:hypothetical protein
MRAAVRHPALHYRNAVKTARFQLDSPHFDLAQHHANGATGRLFLIGHNPRAGDARR